MTGDPTSPPVLEATTGLSLVDNQHVARPRRALQQQTLAGSVLPTSRRCACSGRSSSAADVFKVFCYLID
jgi:hypothetical protein